MSGQWTLAVTSSTGVMGLALGKVSDGDVTSCCDIEVFTDRRHAEEISPRLQELLATAGVAIGDLDRLVIDVGPGRFTGLRVGLASVRALGFALDIPLIGLTSLAVVAASTEVDAGAVTAVIDARRNEVFQQTFDGGLPVTEAVVGRPEDLAPTSVGAASSDTGSARTASAGAVAGDGVDRYLDIYQAAAANSGVAVLTERHPRAAVMLSMSQSLPGVPGTEIQPLYLRDPDAKPNIKTRPTS
jgi:tRNA threonylcarbamoyl adenosine modification protein YeaZ